MVGVKGGRGCGEGDRGDGRWREVEGGEMRGIQISDMLISMF